MSRFQETIDWLFVQLPVYQRTGPSANYKIDLTKTHALMELLDHPENAFPSFHVAGTNGKGSVSHMLASILQEAGYKVGLYTSPHLRDFRERVRINGEMISEEEVVEFVDEYREKFVQLELSFFEMTVGLAFDRFRHHQVDVAVVEVGMGGRLDSTNVVSPVVSVITNIGLDHTAFLGDSLPQIAREKAGIIKERTPVIIGEKQTETVDVFSEIAISKQAPLHYAEDVIPIGLPTDLKGDYQRKNTRTAQAAIAVQKQFEVSEEALRKGLMRVVANTHLAGRWQTLSESPHIICDTGHNTEGVRYIVEQLQKTPKKALHMVWGMVNDKDISSVLELLPKEAKYYFCKADIPRGMDAFTLKETAEKHMLSGAAYPTVKEAVEAAKSQASEADLVFIGGSTFVVAEVV